MTHDNELSSGSPGAHSSRQPLTPEPSRLSHTKEGTFAFSFRSDGSMVGLKRVFEAYMDCTLTDEQCEVVESHLDRHLRDANHFEALAMQGEDELVARALGLPAEALADIFVLADLCDVESDEDDSEGDLASEEEDDPLFKGESGPRAGTNRLPDPII